jgi:hypothetical protein
MGSERGGIPGTFTFTPVLFSKQGARSTAWYFGRSVYHDESYAIHRRYEIPSAAR